MEKRRGRKVMKDKEEVVDDDPWWWLVHKGIAASFLCIAMFALFVRVAVSLHPYSGAGNPPKYGDFEAQRHWMEITLNIPVEEWYRNSTTNDLSCWGLDYPPLTAYQSYVHGLFIRFFHPESVSLFTSRGHESYIGIAMDQCSSVADNMCNNSDSITWLVRFTRAVKDWELGDITNFYRMLYTLKPRVEKDDSLIWTHIGNKKFSVRSYHKALSIHSSTDFPWKSIWRSKIPLKVAFFGWVASHGIILTIDKLRKRGLYLTDWCYMCKCNGESTDHLLLHCKVVKVVWDAIFSRLGIAWVMPKRVIDLLSCWQGIRGNRQIAAVWKMIPLCLMWCTWSERNGCCFEDRERSPDSFRDFFFHTLLLWASSIVWNGTSLNDVYATISST